ncbi:APC family permease [Brevibacterium sp. SIMBA_078]|uniref:APC family permease n=1 Tax=Brevibacterium sp. SIMBA_078 TaxID=3085816 RepID=UPI00397B4DC0
MTTVSNESASPEDTSGQSRLSGNMGVAALVMSVLAFSSPIATVGGTMPVLLMFSGPSAPGIYLIVTAFLLLFTVGLVTMSKHMKNPGGFYSFVTAGFGKPAGLGAAFLALFGYLFIGFFAPSFFAVTVQSFVSNTLHGPEIPWYWYALILILLTTILAYRRIDLSAKVLTVIMILEVALIVTFDVYAFVSGTGSEHSFVFDMPWITDPSLGLALLFAVGNFFGFEATVVYREEVRNPNKTIPRATYLAVVGIGLFYALAAWAYVVYIGKSDVRDQATSNTVSLFNDSMIALTGKIVADVGVVLLITSVLASMLSVQNISARYGFALANDRALPRVFGYVHPKHKSPSVAALAVGAVWCGATFTFAILNTDPERLYAIASGSGTFAVLLVMLLASAAVVAYFQKNKGSYRESGWKTVVAPAIAVLFLGFVTYMAIVNYPELIGGSNTLTIVFITFTFALFFAGFIYAFVLRAKRPSIYKRLGRQNLERDLADS